MRINIIMIVHMGANIMQQILDVQPVLINGVIVTPPILSILTIMGNRGQYLVMFAIRQ